MFSQDMVENPELYTNEYTAYFTFDGRGYQKGIGFKIGNVRSIYLLDLCNYPRHVATHIAQR